MSQIKPPAQSKLEVQLVLHDIASAQMNPPAQAAGVAAGHPAVDPLQDFADVNVLPEQDCGKHCTVEVEQAPDVHAPVRPQGDVATQSGSTVVLGTLVHVPTLPFTLQAWQAPPQALLQQTPSVQKPVVQSVPNMHT